MDSQIRIRYQLAEAVRDLYGDEKLANIGKPLTIALQEKLFTGCKCEGICGRHNNPPGKIAVCVPVHS